jgi:hypothetical protein
MTVHGPVVLAPLEWQLSVGLIQTPDPAVADR